MLVQPRLEDPHVGWVVVRVPAGTGVLVVTDLTCGHCFSAEGEGVEPPRAVGPRLLSRQFSSPIDLAFHSLFGLPDLAQCVRVLLSRVLVVAVDAYHRGTPQAGPRLGPVVDGAPHWSAPQFNLRTAGGTRDDHVFLNKSFLLPCVGVWE